jgi:hypothetical protein
MMTPLLKRVLSAKAGSTSLVAASFIRDSFGQLRRFLTPRSKIHKIYAVHVYVLQSGFRHWNLAKEMNETEVSYAGKENGLYLRYH